MLGATTNNLVTCCLRFVHPWTSVFAVSSECSSLLKKRHLCEHDRACGINKAEPHRIIQKHLKGWIGGGTLIHLPARSPDPASYFLCGTIDRQNL